MAVESFSIPVLSVSNTTNDIQNNKTKTQQWILGMIIGSAPFLFIVICWIFVSLCVNNLARYYQRTKTRHRHINRKNVTDSDIQMVAI